MSDDEHEPWDAPLRRQTVPWANNKVHTRDVQVQTTNSPHRMSLHRASIGGEQSLINTPFTRDSNVPVQCPPEDLSRRNSNNPGYQPPLSKRGSTQPFDSHTNNIDHTGPAQYRKKTQLSSKPFNQAQPSVTRNFNSHESDIRNRNDTDEITDWRFEDQVNRNIDNKIRMNAIKEMEMIGRRNNNDENDDAPPFNFQAMLRKTPHQRASMKRNPVYESVIPSPMSYRRDSEEDLCDSSVAYKSAGGRKDSPEWSPNEMILMSEKYAKQDAWDEECANDGDSVTTEIAPGIVVKGHVAEL